MAEDFGVEDRGHFYDPVGALRDVVVNHLMQVVAATAMEAPSRGYRGTLKDAKVALFKAVAEGDPAHYVRGQYDGYLGIDGVAAGSTTETYAALRLEIENWGWSGVPFFIRTGKRLQMMQTEGLRVVFKRPPKLGFGFSEAEPNQVVIKLDLRWGSGSSPTRTGRTRRARPRGPSSSTWSSRIRAGSGRPPTRSCSMRRWSATTRASRAGRDRGDVAGHAAAPRRPASSSTRTRQARGGLTEPTARGRLRPLARALGDAMSETTTDAAVEQSAAAPSPFPPIADYAFPSTCHTGALVAADGAIDWLCFPAFDAPSVFGSLLDRQAGFMRLGPYGINHPADRGYEPGTNVLVTTWKTPMGWIVVRDASPDDGPHAGMCSTRSRPTRARRPTTTATTCSSAPSSASRARSRSSSSASRRSTTAARRRSGRCRTATSTRRRRPAPGRRSGSGRASRSGSRGTASGAGTSSSRASERTVCMTWADGLAAPRDADEAEARIAATTRFWRSWLGTRAHSRPPLARPGAALRARDQGPHLHADGRDRRRADDVAPGDARRRAELGLPVHVDAGHDLHAAGAPLAQPRLGGRRVHAVRRGPRGQRGRRAADHVRDRRSPRPDRVDARPPVRVRGGQARPDRERRLRPAAERRLRRGARLDPAPHAQERATAATAVAGRRDPGRVRDEDLARARPGDLGGARSAAALRLVEADVLGRARPRVQARRDPRRPGQGGRLARDRRGDPRRHPRARRLGQGRAPAALRARTRSTRRSCSRRSSISSPATTSACARPSQRSART